MEARISVLQPALLSLLAIVLAASLVNRFFTIQRDPKEPTFVPSTIPFFGHILGLLRHRNRYYTKLSAKYNLPIYSLGMLNSQVYVVNSPELVLAVQRHPKTVSFWFIEAKFTAILGGMSRSASDKLLEHVEAMMPGKELDCMIEIAIRTMISSLDGFGTNKAAYSIDLWSWVQREITIATTESVYGPTNPYRILEVMGSFWDFADDTVMLLANSMPSVLAPKGYRGRQRVIEALETYFNANGHQESSILLKTRLQTLEHDITSKDIACFECVNGIAILANTVPTAFWTLHHVFSDPTILETVREQAGALVDVKQDGERLVRTIELGRIYEVPILSSILQESLRYRTSGAGSRMLLEDLVLEDRYLLKKGSFLIIPSHEMHFNQDAWGESVKDFDIQRFLKPNAQDTFWGVSGVWRRRQPVPRYEMFPTSGSWDEPGQDTTNMSLAIAPPKKKVIVHVLPRKGWESGSWACKM